jgi:hypothetical protein
LSEYFAAEISPLRTGKLGYAIDRLIRRLGPTCVPLLGRQLAGPDPTRRTAARAGLDVLATTDARTRVIAELHRIAHGDGGDEGKLAAVGMLGDLGERAAPSFSDPSAIQRHSARALADQLTGPAEVAAAVELMVSELDHDQVVQLVAAMVDAVPPAAARVARELAARLDVDLELRARVADLVPACDPPRPSRPSRATDVAVLVDSGARLVVLATRRVIGGRQRRRWAVLIGPSGCIEDTAYDDSVCDGDPLAVPQLVAEGFGLASDDFEHARALVSAAARRAADTPRGLASAYYLGRDLLELGDVHLGERPRVGASPPLARALELLAFGDPERACELLARCDAADPEVAAALGACALAQGRPADAVAPLSRAAEGDPAWPLHHWNLAVAHHQLGDARACYHALRRFLATCSRPTALCADVDQPSRVARAHRLIAELERSARLTGTPLARAPRRGRIKRPAKGSRPPR